MEPDTCCRTKANDGTEASKLKERPDDTDEDCAIITRAFKVFSNCCSSNRMTEIHNKG